MAVMSSNGNGMIQFGLFEVDRRAGELRRSGTRVKLQEQQQGKDLEGLFLQFYPGAAAS